MHFASAPSSPPNARSVIEIIQQRAATTFFDPAHDLVDDDIKRLAELATCAPSAYNLQNWRLHAVRTREMKARLRAAAFNQAKVEEAAVTFVVSGEFPTGDELADRLAPSIAAGCINTTTADVWVGMARATFRDSERAREEAIRSATLLGATLMFAAEGYGFSTAPMSGFDRESVRRLLGLPREVLPVLLLGVGHHLRARPSQKLRRPLTEILTIL